MVYLWANVAIGFGIWQCTETFAFSFTKPEYDYGTVQAEDDLLSCEDWSFCTALDDMEFFSVCSP